MDVNWPDVLKREFGPMRQSFPDAPKRRVALLPRGTDQDERVVTKSRRLGLCSSKMDLRNDQAFKM